MWRRMPAAVVAAAGLVALAGCSRTTGTVTGVVSVSGQPVSGGGVTFHPLEKGPSAVGTIGPDGRYALAVGTAGGLPPGEYRVTVVGYPELPPWDHSKGAPPAPPVITHAKYGDLATTTLVRTVAAGPNEFDFDLEPALVVRK